MSIPKVPSGSNVGRGPSMNIGDYFGREASAYVKGKSNIIPGETAEGQLSLFSNGAFKTPSSMATSGRTVHSRVMKLIAAEAKGNPPFTPSSRVPAGRGTVGARVRLAARTQELAQKRAKAGVKGRPAPGSITPSKPAPKRIGPQSADEAKVDDLFGIPWGK